ncbi:MAG TPA: hypothetical protein VH063_06300 [Gaiellaceae bacterium]|nr:hypothetical protein [Gaiellaceae bacterium]
MSPLPPPGAPASPPAAPTPAAALQKPGFGLEFRFALIYGALGTIFVASIIGVVVLARQGGPPTPPPWSTWRPAAGTSLSMTTEIANHVSNQYKLNTSGAPLLAIVPSAPEGTRGTTVTPVSTIGFLSSATAQSCCARVVDTTNNVQDQLCGLGARCAITRGVPTAARLRLVRREALELALYTFKYVPKVNAMIAYIPPQAGTNHIVLLYLERSNLQPELDKPISQTLPLTTPPLPTAPDPKEESTIDRLTKPVEFEFIEFKPIGDGTQALIISPTTG